MGPISHLNPGPPAAAPLRNWAGVALVTVAIAGGSYFAGRANLIPLPNPAAAPSPAAPDLWVGVWFKHKDAGDGFELPALEFRKGVRNVAGRMITPGRDGDIGNELDDLVPGEDGLTFVSTAGGRIKYRLVRTGPDAADLLAVPDTAHDLKAYLGTSDLGTSKHSAARREKALQHLNAPRPPERVARMVRVAHAPAIDRPVVAPAAAVPDESTIRNPHR